MTGQNLRTHIFSVSHKAPSRLSPFLPWSDDKVAISGPARALAPVGKPLDEEDTHSGVSTAPASSMVGWAEAGRPICHAKAPKVIGSTVHRGGGGLQHCPPACEGQLDSAIWLWLEELHGALAMKSWV